MDIPIEVIIHLVLWAVLICTMAVSFMRILAFVGADLLKTPQQKDEQWVKEGREKAQGKIAKLEKKLKKANKATEQG